MGMVECQYEDITPHLIVWDMEFRIATEMFLLAVETLNTLLEKKEKSIKFLGLKGRALFLRNRLPEAVPACKAALQMKNDNDALLSLLLRI